VFIIAILAVSTLSTVSAVNAQKVDEANKLPDSYAIPYGVNQNWIGCECNWHATGSYEITTAQHYESSVGNTATFVINARPGETGWNSGGVGVKFTLTGITDWQAVKDRHIAISVKMTYILATNKQGLAFIGIHPLVGAPIDQVNGNYAHVIRTISRTYTSYGGGPALTVQDLVPSGASGNYDGYISANIQCGHPYGTGQQAFGSVIVQSVGLKYL